MTYSLCNKSFRNILFAVIVVLGIALSMLVSLLSYSAGNKLRQEQFNNAVENRYFALRREIDGNLAVLVSFQALYDASEEIERAEFLERVEFGDFAKNILKGHAGIQALELIPRVPDSRRKAYESAARRDGFPDFQLTERSAQGKMNRAEKRKEYFPIYFVEPYKGNEINLGFDLASNPAWREALETARKTGEMFATARITLPRETKNQFGFIVFAPVYRKGALINSDQARWDNLEGFAVSVFRINDIVEKATSFVKPEGVDFTIYDASASEKERFLYSHESRIRNTPLPNKEQSEAGFKNTKTLEVAGRKWMISYSAAPEFIAARSNLHHWGFLLAGSAVTGLVAGFLIFSARHAEQVETSAREISNANTVLTQEIMERKQVEEALRESEERYRSVVDNIAVGVSVINPDMKILSLNAMMKKWFPFIDSSTTQLCYKEFNDPPGKDICSYCPTIKTLKDGKVHDAVTATPAGDGFRYYRIISSPLFDKEGRIIAAVEMVDDITERKKAEETLQRYSAELEKSNRLFQEALANIRQLSGMLPICASCKKIRDDKGYWRQVEAYVSEHTEAVFSHGMCPDCEKKAYEELEKLKNENT